MFKDKKYKYTLIYAAIAGVLIIFINSLIVDLKTENIKYTDFKKMVIENKIQEVQVQKDRLVILPKEEKNKSLKIYYTTKIDDPDIYKFLDQYNVSYDGGKIDQNSPIKDFLYFWVLPIVGFYFIGKFLFGKMDKKMGGSVMSFGKNTAKLYGENETGITFNEVAGQDEAKESLLEIVDFLHNPQKYKEIGAKLPKGALLVGPPGTGKTLLAKAVAGEAKVPFFSISGSDFVEMFVGMGAARVRDLFKQAEEKAPCIIFIDEIDAIGKKRDGSIPTGNDEREQTLNQLLSEMDGFDSSKGVVILAATNRPEILDHALLRPGRFDRRIIVDKPDLKGREEILKVHIKGVKMDENVDLLSLAKSTPGAVGADLANIVNESALRAVKKGRNKVIQQDMEEAVEIVIAGEEKKNRILSKNEKLRVAYHEVGHALLAALLKHTDKVHKITIVPRTMGALGYTMQLPAEEKYLVSKEEMEEEIIVMLGGRAAEEVKFNSISTGASNDIERATKSARSMVTIYGMTDEFDMMGIESATDVYLDGRNVSSCSSKTIAKVDEETLKIIRNSHDKAKTILSENYGLLDNIANYLFDKENITGEEFENLIKEFNSKEAANE